MSLFLSSGCAPQAPHATESQLDWIVSSTDYYCDTHMKVDEGAAIDRSKVELVSEGFTIKMDQAVPEGRMLIGSHEVAGSALGLAKVVVSPAENGSQVKVKIWSFDGGASHSKVDEERFLIAIGAMKVEVEHEASTAELRDEKQRAMDAWNSLPPADRIAGRQWQDTLDRYIRLGYQVDEAELMADRIVGGRPRHLPPLGSAH